MGCALKAGEGDRLLVAVPLISFRTDVFPQVILAQAYLFVKIPLRTLDERPKPLKNCRLQDYIMKQLTMSGERGLLSNVNSREMEVIGWFSSNVCSRSVQKCRDRFLQNILL